MSALIENAGEYSRGSLFYLLPKLVDFIEFDYKLFLSKIDKKRSIWK